MGIKAISRREFDQLGPARAPEAEEMMDEQEWFADDGGCVTGLLALDRTDRDWFVVVLGRDEQGQFRAIDVESCIAHVDQARAELLERMARAVATGLTVFPQADG
jgi:hypothetical protein